LIDDTGLREPIAPTIRPDGLGPGGKRMFFCAERDVHQGSLRALMLPELPASVRRAAQGLKGKPITVDLARRDIIRQDVLELHGR
jgi:hypothetical protein